MRAASFTLLVGGISEPLAAVCIVFLTVRLSPRLHVGLALLIRRPGILPAVGPRLLDVGEISRVIVSQRLVTAPVDVLGVTLSLVQPLAGITRVASDPPLAEMPLGTRLTGEVSRLAGAQSLGTGDNWPLI